MWKCIVFSQIASNFLEEGPSNPWPPPPPPQKTHMVHVLYSQRIFSLVWTHRVQTICPCFSLSLCLLVLLVLVCPLHASHAHFIRIYSFIYSPISSANPEGLAANIKRESQRIQAHTQRSPSSYHCRVLGKNNERRDLYLTANPAPER